MTGTRTLTPAQNEALEGVLAALAHNDMAGDLGPHLTCPEADAFHAFLEAFGEEVVAAILHAGHSDCDGPDDAHYVENP